MQTLSQEYPGDASSFCKVFHQYQLLVDTIDPNYQVDLKACAFELWV